MSKFLENMSDKTLDDYISHCIAQALKYEFMLNKYKHKALDANEEKINRIVKNSS